MTEAEWEQLWLEVIMPMLGQLQPSTALLLHFTHKFKLYRWSLNNRDLAHVIVQDYQQAIRVLIGISKEEEYIIPYPKIPTTLSKAVPLATKLPSKQREEP